MKNAEPDMREQRPWSYGMVLPPFEQIYREYHPLLYRTIKRLNAYQAREDLLQVGRLALWEAYRHYDPSRGPFPALAQVYVRGRMLNSLAQLSRWDSPLPFSSLSHDEEKRPWDRADPKAQGAFEQSELRLLLEEVWPQLSPREQLVITHQYWLDRPLAELAAQEQVSIHTVKTWRKMALQKIRAALSPTR